MATCSECGAHNRAGATFCDACGARLDAAPPARETRKTVTVLFCDVTGSTALGESTDPEALRALLARYFERMQAVVERHGGTVEKFIGDAVMAVFGVPVVHEDDALRACRAAVEMRDALPELGVQARIGVNTGEVVAGTAERLVTGDAVNVAARLEQAARPGEILIGPETYRLVRTAVEADSVEPLSLKGKSEPMPAHRLSAITNELVRRSGAPLVGRGNELARLQTTFAQAVADRSCQLFTVLGMPGVGKSRLAGEFLATVDAHVVTGRCLSYGEGITYWPVVEILKQIAVEPSDPSATAALRSLLGTSDVATTADAIAWAFRKLLEEQAQERPLVVVFDDIHWGEQTFLDLIEHVANLSRDAPLLLVCMARPELLEKRPGWGGGKWNATAVLLEPLNATETERLIDALGGVDEGLRTRILDAADGNPLFVEEMLALVRESGGAAVEVPPTIQALLAARLDQLDPAERIVLERGSIEGRTFHRGAVVALSDGDGHVSTRLVSLVRKELVRPDKARLPGDDAYRFRHLLIRDAAYYALPKAVRADLHERFADWLEEYGGDLVERDEILGHHLEQAALYKAELGLPDPALAESAGDRLAAAGRRAVMRGDSRAARTLLTRSLELLRPTRLEVHLELDLAIASMDEPQSAANIAESVAARARAAGDDMGAALAELLALWWRSFTGSPVVIDEVDARVHSLLEAFTESDDHLALTHLWAVRGSIANIRGRMGEWAVAAERASQHARLAGRDSSLLFGLPTALMLGPCPADEALRTLDATLPETPLPSTQLLRAVLLAMLGRFEEANALAAVASERLRESTGAGGEEWLAEIASFAGDHAAAATLLQEMCRRVESQGNVGLLSTYAPLLGRSLCMLGRFDEADAAAERGREVGYDDDVATQIEWRRTKALVCAHRGDAVRAEELAREAVALAERTDILGLHALAVLDLGEVLATAGRYDEAASTCAEALALFERKRNIPMAARVRERLAAMSATR